MPDRKLTSIVSYPERGIGGNNRYRGNCSPKLIEDLISFFKPSEICDYMCGSGTTKAAADNCKIKVVSTYNGDEEAQYVVDEIKSLIRDRFDYSQMAVLVRTAAQTRSFEEKFIAAAIPYQVIGGLKFYERAEIRDALAYFRVILQPHDDLALERIINKPARGIGAKSIEKFQDYARSHHISMFTAIEQMLAEGLISGKSKKVLEDSGYIDMLKMDKSVEAPGRLENLKELISVMGDTDNYPSLADFMEHVSLVMDNDNITDPNKVKLITLHSAKGLEFDVVFLPGWEEGLFPHQRAMDEGGTEALEEERRLAYVAITRARQKLYILMAHNRRVYGQWQNNLPSRFINELPPANIEICNKCTNFYTENRNNYNSGWNNKFKPHNYTGKHNWNNNDDEVTYDDDSRYSYTRSHASDRAAYSNIIGTRVHHDTFGYGKIVAAEGNKLEVFFDDYGRKKLMASYVNKVD